jgi:hypothetical protein
MTFDPSRYPVHLVKIRYVDPPRNAVPVRRSGQALVKAALVTAAAAFLLVAGIGFAQAVPAAPDRVTDAGPVRGEFRLGAGNQQPPGYEVPLKPQLVPEDTDVQWRPSLVPLR